MPWGGKSSLNLRSNNNSEGLKTPRIGELGKRGVKSYIQNLGLTQQRSSFQTGDPSVRNFRTLSPKMTITAIKNNS